MQYVALGLVAALAAPIAIGAVVGVLSFFQIDAVPARPRRDGQCADCDDDALPDEPWCGPCRQLAYAI